MIESAASSAEFLILSDLSPADTQWAQAQSQMEDVRQESARILGFRADVRLERTDAWTPEPGRETFLIPAALDFSLWEREALGQRIAALRRDDPALAIHHDDVDPGHPLVAEILTREAVRALGGVPAQQAGLILAASGHGDSGSRAQSYRLMRLMWEQAGLARAEVAFVRHAQPFLVHVFEGCAREPFPWVVVFQAQWETEHWHYACVIFENFQRAHPAAASWRFASAPGAQAMFTAWYTQRMARLWQQKRASEAARLPSARRSPASAEAASA